MKIRDRYKYKKVPDKNLALNGGYIIETFKERFHLS